MTKQEIKISTSKETIIQSIMKSILPGIQILKIKKFDEGYNNDSYDLTFSNRHVVLKLIRGNTKNRQKELTILESLSKSKQHKLFPKVIKSDFNSKNPYMLFEFLDGVPLSTVFEKVNNIEEVMEQLGQLKATFNSKKYSFFGRIDSANKEADHYEQLSEYFDAGIQKTFQKLNEDTENEHFVNELKLFWSKHKTIFNNDKGPCLCHGDTGFSNILVKNAGFSWKIVVLIDFEYAYSGGAASDLYSSSKSFLQIAPYLDSIEKGYTEISSLPKNWKKILWLSIWHRCVQWFELLPSMSWQELSFDQEKERKQKLKNKLRNIMAKAKFTIEGEK